MPPRIRSLTLPGWRDPERVFLALGAAAERVAWLDAGPDATEGRSILAIGAGDDRTVTANRDDAPDDVYASLREPLADGAVDAREHRDAPSPVGWIGWFAYEFGARTLGLPAAPTTTPEAAFLFAERVVVFDHALGRVRLEWLEGADAAGERAAGDATPGETWARETAEAIAHLPATAPGTHDAVLEDELPPEASVPPAVRWRHDAAEYERMIADCREAIARGDAYQLCLTNRVDVDVEVDPVQAYRRLRRSSPTHHGAFLRLAGVALLSASPEQFLEVGTDGTVSTRPMKGTRPRSADPERDEALRAELLASEKERAENLMIVDLMRNDLARVAEVGGVAVPSLLAVEEYPHVHQLVSTVTARLRHPLTALDAVRAAFPAGSMTGAPKESAMRILHALEGGPRGVYSGAFGRIGVDGSADLAMVIRTIVVAPGAVSIGTGGGITTLSHPAEEVEETRLKARALLAVLGGRADGL
ncbi:hypothetical protein ARHIZOSPH14_32910 [Agromyces rhizosphaerae]|uniref:aminodeoxychorismate synthase n=1 Tax=Agromyces rhizosphaerae TaxID=88374 RepID=A0A9W6D1C9_9MICO|nr:aminodeoxychorismate synthase component I [Agromyces rhizosphaerae]GLI29049.1 hypothetical protein ARHIZOSPH14_32910 [Agromyces rhizosphaerae]